MNPVSLKVNLPFLALHLKRAGQLKQAKRKAAEVDENQPLAFTATLGEFEFTRIVFWIAQPCAQHSLFIWTRAIFSCLLALQISAKISISLGDHRDSRARSGKPGRISFASNVTNDHTNNDWIDFTLTGEWHSKHSVAVFKAKVLARAKSKNLEVRSRRAAPTLVDSDFATTRPTKHPSDTWIKFLIDWLMPSKQIRFLSQTT